MRLILSAEQYARLTGYLFADDLERIAFLYIELIDSRKEALVHHLQLLGAVDYVQRDHHSVELREQVRPEVIRAAHAGGYGVAEAHAHGWPGPATRFSATDLDGLRELGPHMTWRLLHAPYTALVFGPDSFDALQWQPGGAVTTIDGLVVDAVLRHPTGLSLHAAELAMGRLS